MKSLSLVSLGYAATAVAAMQMGCSDPASQDALGTGGSSSSASATSSGGSSNTIQSSSSSTGGTSSTSGSRASKASTAIEAGGSETAGETSSGGASTSGNGKGGSGNGGSSSAAHSKTGGASSTGGMSGAGSSNGGVTAGAGTLAAGGSPGGAPGAANWGKEEDPGAQCSVTDQLPDYAALKADSKLPDPFTKLDGTRIKDKSEWACRREEILKQLFKYVYGDKPIPAKGSVTGTVSSSKISVKVSDGGKSCSFDVTVAMNGATAPAPAIIIYDGGMGAPLPIPSGVAKITFSAIEASGGSGAKTGPFYNCYGTNHPAGYMVAQAWQVSRIIDLLEQNPGTIDAGHIGVTGCSRNGKGAFAAGVFDNRVALTLPCESGIGGTVGLRLKEQLDPGANDTAEWPYHAISYVRWLSEVALGPFAKSNDAAGDNTDRLPVDMHEAMALIAPRALYILDNPGISNLDPKSAYVTAMAGKAIFEALGVGDHFAYQGAGGTHCSWRTQYDASLTAMIDRFLKGKDSTKTGSFATDLSSKPNTAQYYSWDTTELSGDL